MAQQIAAMPSTLKQNCISPVPRSRKPAATAADVAAGADDAADAAEALAIDERHERVERAAGHMGEQAEDDHEGHGESGDVHRREGDQKDALAHHEREQQPGAALETRRPGDPVGEDAAERTGEQGEKTERADGVAGILNAHVGTC